MIVHRDEIDSIRAEFVCQIGKGFQRLIICAADDRVDADGQFPFVLVAPEIIRQPWSLL